MLSKKPLNTQSVDKLLNLSTTPNPLYEGQMLSTGALEEINKLKQPSVSPMPQSPPRVPSAMPPQNVIRNAGIQMMPEEPSDDSSNFLGSLIAQGITGIGTGLMGGDSYDIMRSANVFQNMRDRQANEKRAKLLTDPKSEESKKRRMVFKNLGYDVPEDLTYADLNDSNVLQGLRSRNQQSVPMKVGIKAKPEKGIRLEDKDNDELAKVTELRNLTNSLANSVKDKGNAWIGGASKEQDTLKYGIAATMGVLKGQGAMTMDDIKFWNDSLAISPNESKEEYSNRLKNVQKSLIDKQIIKLKNKGFEVEYKEDENKYYVFPKGDSLDPIAEF
jgi:hypothetical protein